MSLQVVLSEINHTKQKCIPFDRYMELCLYHHTEGYYVKEKKKIGSEGDFYTSSSVSAVFGQVWSDVFRFSISEKNLPACVIEIGAGDGRFASHVLAHWEKADPYSYEALIYHIVEESPSHRAQIADLLCSHKNVRIHSSLAALQKECSMYKGIVFANELLDAMPVKVIRKRDGLIEELHVGAREDGKLCELWEQAAYLENTPQAQRVFQGEDGTTAEVPLQMERWLHSLYSWLEKDSVVYFVDYGYTAEEWKLPHLKDGSIRGYRKHQLVRDILAFPGNMDLTSHVDWGAVAAAGSKANMTSGELMSQSQFLLENGILNFLESYDGRDPFSKEAKSSRAIRSFLLNSSLGEGFQVLSQVKA